MYIYTGRWFLGCPAYQSGPGTPDTRETIGPFYNRENIRRDIYYKPNYARIALKFFNYVENNSFLKKICFDKEMLS